MDNLRLILILLGVAILVAIVLLHRPKGQSQPNHARWRRTRREPTLSTQDAAQEEHDDDPAYADSARASSFPSFSARSAPSGPGRTARAPEPTAPEPSRQKSAGSTASKPDKIITLYIRRREERRIGGSDLLDAAVKAGLSFGEMNIFHRRHEGADKPVFSMANLTPPGHFDASAWNVFDSPGVALFATLPGPVSALDTWDAMLATGRRIAELLDAEVLDDGKCVLTRQRIAQIREDLREYDRQHGLIGG